MEEKILQLKPERLWHHFSEICKVPRPSKKEEKIAEYLLNFGRIHGLQSVRDEIGNVLIRKAGTLGKENGKTDMDRSCTYGISFHN